MADPANSQESQNLYVHDYSNARHDIDRNTTDGGITNDVNMIGGDNGEGSSKKRPIGKIYNKKEGEAHSYKAKLRALTLTLTP